MTRFIEIPSNPVPENAEAFEFRASDGAPMRGAFFPAENARGGVVLVTGWSEFIEKYFEAVDRLRARGLSVAMMDWRGQGLSDRESLQKTKWENYFEQVRDDLRVFTENEAAPRMSAPLILMTHSMGGLPALMLLAEGYDRFARAVLCAPMTRLFSEPTHSVFNLVGAGANAIGLATKAVARGEDDSMSFEGNMFTTDPDRHERFRQLQLAEPKAANAAPTYGWVHQAIKSSLAIHKPGYFDKLQTPVRIISAELERRIDSADHAVIASRSEHIDQVVIDGALHEIMMERDEIQDRYWKAVDDFIAPAFTA